MSPTDGLPPGAAAAFDAHDAFAPAENGYNVESARFEAVVSGTTREGTPRYELVVRIPSLDAATAEHVAASVQSGWFETMERRLAEAPKSTRASVELTQFSLADVDAAGDQLAVTYGFEAGDPSRAARIAKTFAEYVEGTYVESVVPGYEYDGAVADLLSAAASTGGDDAESGATPL